MNSRVTLADRSDRELMQLHTAGDPDAFGEIFRRHKDRMWAVAMRTCGDREMAADCVQDAFISAFRRADSYRGEAAVTTWLHRVVVNACLDRLRAQKVRAADALPDDLDGLDRGSLITASAESVDPAAQTLAHERRTRVLAALARLPAEQRAALVLVDMEGYPVAEAAEILSCPVGTLKSRCSRGRAKMAELLADLGSVQMPPPGNPTPPRHVSSQRPPRGPPRAP